MFDGQGKNCTYTYVSIFKNNVIPLQGKIFALYSNISAETFLMTIPHVFCETWSCHCKRQDSFCVCGFTQLHKEVLLGLARAAAAPRTAAALFWFPRTQVKVWNRHSSRCCPIRGSAKMGLDMMYLPLSCLGPFRMLSSPTCRTQSAGYKCGLLHLTGRWALPPSSVILINSSCWEFTLSPSQWVAVVTEVCKDVNLHTVSWVRASRRTCIVSAGQVLPEALL